MADIEYVRGPGVYPTAHVDDDSDLIRVVGSFSGGGILLYILPTSQIVDLTIRQYG